MNLSRKRSGFTLVEILVAIVVLLILEVIFAEMTSMTAGAIHFSNQSVDASAEAYLSFDRIGMDLAALVKRPDVDFDAQNPASPFIGSGNIMLFLAGVDSAGLTSTTDRAFSMVAYAINYSSDNGGLPCLLRAGKPIAWTNSGFMGNSAQGLPLSFSDPSFPAALLPQMSPAAPATSDFDVLAPGVVRLVVGFQLYPDNLSVTLADGSTPTPATAQGQIVYSPPIRSIIPTGGGTAVNYVDVKRIAAIVVGVVALDVPALKPETAAQVASIAGAFPIPANGVLPLKSWTSIANSMGSTGPTSVFLSARQAVHVFQRTFPITPYGMKGN